MRDGAGAYGVARVNDRGGAARVPRCPASNGATVSDDLWLDATASAGTASVSFEVSGGSVIDEMVSSSVSWEYGWLGAWDSRTCPTDLHPPKRGHRHRGGLDDQCARQRDRRRPSSTMVIIPAASGATLDSAQGYIFDTVASAGATAVTFSVKRRGHVHRHSNPLRLDIRHAPDFLSGP